MPFQAFLELKYQKCVKYMFITTPEDFKSLASFQIGIDYSMCQIRLNCVEATVIRLKDKAEEFQEKTGSSEWLGSRDSNPDSMIQSHVSCLIDSSPCHKYVTDSVDLR